MAAAAATAPASAVVLRERNCGQFDDKHERQRAA
jgi:hypothetical protein